MPYSIGTPAACSTVSPSGTAQAARGRHAHQLGMGAVAHRRHDRLADVEALHAVADLAHGAGRLVAHDVGLGGEHSPLAVEQVAALDADGAHLHQEPAGPQRRIGHLLVPEHLGPAGLVEHRCLHRREPTAGPLDRRPLTADRRAGSPLGPLSTPSTPRRRKARALARLPHSAIEHQARERFREWSK